MELTKHTGVIYHDVKGGSYEYCRNDDSESGHGIPP